MAEGFRAFERNTTPLRPIIPTPYSSIPVCPDLLELENHNMLNHYYETYLRLLRQNNTLNNQLQIINSEKQELSQKFQSLKSEQQKKKRHRRTADEIRRNHECPIKSCGKSYGSDGSLLQHIKIKHFDFYQSEQYEHLLVAKQKKKNNDQLSS